MIPALPASAVSQSCPCAWTFFSERAHSYVTILPLKFLLNPISVKKPAKISTHWWLGTEPIYTLKISFLWMCLLNTFECIPDLFHTNWQCLWKASRAQQLLRGWGHGHGWPSNLQGQTSVSPVHWSRNVGGPGSSVCPIWEEVIYKLKHLLLGFGIVRNSARSKMVQWGDIWWIFVLLSLWRFGCCAVYIEWNTQEQKLDIHLVVSGLLTKEGLGIISSWREQSGNGMGRLGQWWSPHPWRHIRGTWMWLLVTGFGRSGSWLDLVILKVFFNFIWLYESIKPT